MEFTGSLPDVSADLTDLSALLDRPGPFATAVLTTDPTVENAAFLSGQRWRAVREELAAQGAPEEVLRTLDRLVPDAHHAGSGMFVVAHAAGVCLREALPARPRRAFGRWGPLPSLVPLIEGRQVVVPHVVVTVSRQEASITAVGPGADELERGVRAEVHPTHRASVGGWSQRRYQARVEHNWESNARSVADQAEEVAGSVDAEVILVSGDITSRDLLIEALPKELADRAVVIGGGREGDGSGSDLAVEVDRQLATEAARTTREALELFHQERGRGERAVEGIRPTAAALARAQVGLLLVHDDPDSERQLWFGPEPVQVTAEPGGLRALGVEEPASGRAVDVLVRAALGTGAGIRVVPRHGGPAEGVGALLRWS